MLWVRFSIFLTVCAVIGTAIVSLIIDNITKDIEEEE